MATSSVDFLVGRREDDHFVRECTGEFWPGGAGFSFPIKEGTTERTQVEAAVRYLLAEEAAAVVDLDCGLRVSLY